jgi:hypothetical protein
MEQFLFEMLASLQGLRVPGKVACSYGSAEKEESQAGKGYMFIRSSCLHITLRNLKILQPKATLYMLAGKTRTERRSLVDQRL